jgi:hypothetical protein
LIIVFLVHFGLYAGFEFDIETGALFSGYNDVRIPGDTGTKFSLSEEIEADPQLFYRLKIYYHFNDKHHLSALYAPLTIESEGKLDRDLDFDDGFFPAGSPLKTRYTFNSYRISYRYDFLLRENWQIGAGFTAKIRDAVISVEDDSTKAEKENVGFVPIINFRIAWNFSERAGLLIEGDALAAPQGRAEDILAAFTYELTDSIRLKAGYRILEGGADNDEVYTFSLFHYAVLGFLIDF